MENEEEWEEEKSIFVDVLKWLYASTQWINDRRHKQIGIAQCRNYILENKSPTPQQPLRQFQSFIHGLHSTHSHICISFLDCCSQQIECITLVICVGSYCSNLFWLRNISKMIVTLRSKMIVQKLIGDGNLFSKFPDKLKCLKSNERALIPSVVMVPLLLTSLMTSIDSILKIRTDVIGAFSSMMVTIGYSLLLAIYCHFVFNREKFYSFLDDMEDIISDSA